MLLELAKPVTLVGCILSLYAVFNSAFLFPIDNLRQRTYDSLALLALAAAVSLISGLIFREAEESPAAGSARLMRTLPVQVFCWAASAMLVLFVVSWYLENYCVFYRDVRF